MRTITRGLWLVSMHLSPGVADVAVLNAEHHVGVGAAAGGLLEQSAALQRGRHARLPLVTRTPRLAEASGLLPPFAGGPVPYHLVWPVATQKVLSGPSSSHSEMFVRRLAWLWLTMCCR